MYILYNVMIYWYVDHFGLTFYVLTQGHPWLLTQGHPWLLGKCFMQNLEIFYLKKNDGRYIDIDGDMLVHVRRIQQGVSWHSVFHFLCSVKTEFSRSVAMSLPTLAWPLHPAEFLALALQRLWSDPETPDSRTPPPWAPQTPATCWAPAVHLVHWGWHQLAKEPRRCIQLGAAVADRSAQNAA